MLCPSQNFYCYSVCLLWEARGCTVKYTAKNSAEIYRLLNKAGYAALNGKMDAALTSVNLALGKNSQKNFSAGTGILLA